MKNVAGSFGTPPELPVKAAENRGPKWEPAAKPASSFFLFLRMIRAEPPSDPALPVRWKGTGGQGDQCNTWGEFMVLSIAEMVLPVLLMFLLGWLCSRKKILSMEGLAGIKALVGNVLLPVVLFNAFFTAEYSGRIAITFGVVYVSCGLGLALGFLLRRCVKPYDRFFPFLVTNFEGGMMGYAMFGLLYAGQTHIFAMVDIGQTLAAYTIFMLALQAVNQGRVNAGAVLKSAVTNPALIGALLGVVLGATGVGKAVLSSAAGSLVSGVISFVTAPVSGLILVIVGYELSFSRKLMKPVMIAVGLRIAVTAVLLAIGSLVIFQVIPFEKPLFVALMLGWSLPAPFIIPLYADLGKDGEFISTALSMDTIVSILLFIPIAAYTLA